MKENLKSKGKEMLKTSYGFLKENAKENYLNNYWHELFKCELKNIQTQAENHKLTIPDNPIMLMTLGTSMEPLVLAIHLVNPEKLYVLYTASAPLDKLQEGLQATGYPEEKIKQVKGISIGKYPTSVSAFKILRGKHGNSQDNLNKNENYDDLMTLLQDSDCRKDIIFDITGAKKTISGGCLLFAAYYDIPVYYMDFGDDPGDRHPDLDRPLPGACFYTRQKNPIAGFCLKDIEITKNHFDKEHFAIATGTARNNNKQNGRGLFSWGRN